MKKIQKACIVLVSVLLVLSFVAFGGRSYKATIKEFVNASMEADAGALVALMPKEFVSAAIEQGEYSNKKALVDDLQSTLTYMNELFDNVLGSGWEFSYKIDNTYTYDKDDIEMFFVLGDGYFNELEGKITDAMDVDFTLTVTNEGESSQSSVMVTLLKIGRKWYVANFF